MGAFMAKFSHIRYRRKDLPKGSHKNKEVSFGKIPNGRIIPQTLPPF